ncbi:hypothetical protein SAMN05216174_102192 [Actinokineospora iranica]|uniref:Uncharacterized protein n=2 Tax=Actinokineospora iranica TaxID=1271860 RepID=A0A1G6LQK3_9PSEU|nr:hypothetical protein SAMN05216174_102192 [Actinokineospora iranica]
MPWETTVTAVFGKHLTGMAVGLQTNLDLAGTGRREEVPGRQGRRAGARGQSCLGEFAVEYAAMGQTNWEQRIEGLPRQVTAPRGIFD